MINRLGTSLLSLRVALLLLGITATGLSACSDDDNPSVNLCRDVTCANGVCDPDNGLCANADDCAGDDALCLAGYSCNVDTCEADLACDNGSCERGVCVDGACINPLGCATNANCLDGFYCNDGTCEADPCADTTCDRGVCQVGSGECVNATVCTTATEATDCLDGNRCVGGVCQTETEFCDNLNCDRGVCSFEALACANSENCAGDDANCLVGNFCDDDNTCKPNICDALSQTCPRGECDPGTGQCINADTCQNQDDCVDNFVCIGAACVAADEACGTAGCEGNQICNYDDANSTATCEENPAGCSNALDCSGDRVCADGVCAAPAACVNDGFEPNNADGEETNYLTANATLPVSMTLCGSDVDRIVFNTNEDADLTGTLVADVTIAEEDLGLGVLAISLFNSSGTEVGTARTESNGTPTRTARIEYTITDTNADAYTLVVNEGGDLSTAGIRYSARMDVVDADVIAACAAPEVLTVGTPISSTTVGSTTALTSSCGDLDGVYEEKIYTFTTDKPVQATFVASPLSTTTDVVVSVRAVCEQSGSELGCADARGLNANETLKVALQPGTYVVAVEAANDVAGGPFALSVSTEDIVCSQTNNVCLDATTLSVCNAAGTAFDTLVCQFGCDAATSQCLRAVGDTCANPIVVDAAAGFTGLIEWENYQADYDPGDPSCVPNNDALSYSTEGFDAVYQVVVPPGQVMTAALDQRSLNYIAAYLVEDCADLANTCLAASNNTTSNDEKIFYHNGTAADQTLYLIADVKPRTSYVASGIEIGLQPFVCTPGTSRCVLDREAQVCNSTGTGYDSTIQCENGCDETTGLCATTNDTCGGATQLPSGVTVAGTTVGYLHDYRPNTDLACSEFSGDASDNAVDAVFAFTTTAPNQRVKIEVTNVSGIDPFIWISDTCNPDDTLGTCLAGADGSESAGVSETLERVIPNAGTYYVVVEHGDSSTTTTYVGTFDIKATISDVACTPYDPAVLACNVNNSGIEYCDALGNIATYTCNGSCLAGDPPTCSSSTGGNCFEPALLTDGITQTGNEAGNFSGVADVSLPRGTYGTCDINQSTTGVDSVYAFDLAAGDVLDVTARASTTSGVFYLMAGGVCGDPDTCVDFQKITSSSTPVTFQYLATQPERVYFVVDYTGTSATSATWSFDWEITATNYACLPGSATCLDATTRSLCSPDGSSLVNATCPSGTCDAGDCIFDPLTSDTCATAPDVGFGGTFIVDQGLFTNDHDIESSNNCFAASSGSEGKDAYVSVTLQPFQVLKVSGTSSTTSAYPVIFLFSDCADITGTCQTGVYTASTQASLTYQAGPVAESLIVALDTSSSSDTVILGYEVEIKEPECLPSTPLSCSADNSSLVYCDNGTLAEYLCAGGCLNNACVQRRGDICADAIPLLGTNGTIDGDWATNSNAVNVPSTLAGGCTFDSIDYPDGPDEIYTITLAAGETLEAELVTATTAAHLYVVGDCYKPRDTCLVSDRASRTEATLRYHSPLGEKVYVVVDRDDASTTGTFRLNYAVSSGVCAPGTSRCLDATTVETCDAKGVPTTATCLNGCANSACVSGAEADQCETAVPIGGNVAIIGDYDSFSTSYTFSSDCAGAFEAGPDAYYSVNLLAGQIVRTTLYSFGDEPPILYYLQTCADEIAACLAGTHEDAPGQSANVVTLDYTASADETVIIGIDNEFSTADEGFYFTVEILTPNCDPATFAQVCTATGDGFTFCNPQGLIEDYLCLSTCNAATGRCDEPLGDVCLDPLVATPTALGVPLVLTGTLGDYTNDYDLGTGNACTQSQTPAPEPVYVVDLLAGQTLTASVVSTATSLEDLALYITKDCSNMREQCLDGADAQASTAVPEQLTYVATENGPVYLVVDSFYAAAAGTFDLQVTVQ